MLLLGFDTETTGLDVTTDTITECGAVLWDTELRAPLMIYNAFVKDPAQPPISDEITQLTGITQALLDTYGTPVEEVIHQICLLMRKADAVVAHNGFLFDKPLLENCTNRVRGFIPCKIWIDTSTDVEYPERTTTRKLTHLAAEHKFLNPFEHRAVFDVLTMLKVLDHYDINRVYELAQQPTVMLQALVGYNDRELAKARGYRWKAETKQWLKSMKESFVKDETDQAVFQVKILDM